MIRDILSNVECASKASEKKELLKESGEVLKLLFDDCYNANKYNIKVDEAFSEESLFSTKTIDENYAEFHQLLVQLSSREKSGNEAKACVNDMLSQFTAEDRKWLIRVLNKNLKIGVSGAKFQEWNGIESDKFTVTLANQLDKAKNVNVLDGNWYASSKLDGCRCLTVFELDNGKFGCHFFSRQGKEFKTLDVIKRSLENVCTSDMLMDGKYILDGEICIVDEDGNEDFQAIMKEIGRKDHTILNPKYILFDFATYEEFIGKETGPNFDTRYAALKSIFDAIEFEDERFCATPHRCITVLRQELIIDQEDFDRWSRYVSDGNWEGFMLRKNIPFEAGRSNNLLKVKKFEDAEYVVKDVEVGMLTTAEPGKGNVSYEGVKSLIIEHKGNLVNVGSGLTKEQRQVWKEKPELIIGKTITVKYFEETKNQSGEYSLRFPTLKYVYENGRNV